MGYLNTIIQRYEPRDSSVYVFSLPKLKGELISWASNCYEDLLISGSIAKGTAISLSSDIDYLISLKSNCNESNDGLRGIYISLFNYLKQIYPNIRVQNVSFRINLGGLEVDVTPGRKHPGNTNDHSIYISKRRTWTKTNIRQHIYDISNSGRQNEIKLLKIWREIYNLDFPSIYLEYLVVDNILSGKSKEADKLGSNFHTILLELAKDIGNPLFDLVEDPSNSTNIFSNLLNSTEKKTIIQKAKESVKKEYWKDIIY